jgi:tripartite-type tricarboxylate transporter receptor subunit TctC
MTDLVAGTIQAISIGNGTVAPFVEQGLLRNVATAGRKRLSYLPDLPTAAEIGLPRWEVETWYALFAPRGTPKSIADELNGHIQAMFRDPAHQKKFAESFYDPMPMSADAFAARVKADVAKWERIVKETGVEAQ